ncbi:MAG TPA: Mrp/NBP35 family ATP-binding protein [Micavibrio sp.]
MSKNLKSLIEDALRTVIDPQQGGDIITRGMVSGLQEHDGQVVFAIEVDPKRGPALEDMRQQAENAVRAVAGVKSVQAVLTAERPRMDKTPDPHGMNKNPVLDLPIKHVIAVASGKGGVGKSTVAINLAVALSQAGLQVGLLDADIYGPSVPHLSGVTGKPTQDAQGQIVPHRLGDLKIMSIGFLVAQDTPMIWRGPMVQTALYQMLRDVAWGTKDAPLDVLVVDMPPGTGDAQLTLAQKVPLAGAVIVSTPQDLALIDARKGIAMFEQVKVPVLGLIENMSYHICSQCGHSDHIFGHGGARAEAAKIGVPFLGEIPLHADIRRLSDEGLPVAAQDHPLSQIYRDIATRVAEILAQAPRRKAV